MKNIIIDLTKAIKSGMEIYPSDPEVSIDIVKTIEEDGWELRNMNFGTHTGTHVDAFSHMLKGGKSIDDMPLNSFFGPAKKVSNNSILPRNIGLIFEGEIDINSFKKIVNANPKFVAGKIDENLQKELLKMEIITYTDLINIEKLPTDKEFMFYGIPLKISEGDGSPVRAFAIVEYEKYW